MRFIMHTRKVLGLLAIVVFLLSACGFRVIRGSGDLVTESRSVSNFDRVSLSGSGEVIVTQSGEESLTVETDDNIIEYVTTEVRGGTLYLGFDTTGPKSISPTRLRFDLNVKELIGLKISGSGEITAASLDTDRLEVGVSGSGDVEIDSLTAQEVEVRISGSGNVELAGEATGQDITVSGSGKLRAGDLRSETVEVSISGSGDATVWAIESLDARISGSGSVEYYGSPTVDSSGSGSGKVRHLGGK
jgi:hypothetical protein